MEQLTVSVSTGMFADLTPKECIDVLSEAGYIAAEMGSGYVQGMMDAEDEGGRPAKEAMKEFRAYAEEKGVSVSQAHLVWRSGLVQEHSLDILKRNIELYEILGAKYMVIHVMGEELMPYEEVMRVYYDRQIGALRELLGFIGGGGTVLCIENLGKHAVVHTGKRIMKLIRDLDNDPHLGVCLDTGHLNIVNGVGFVEESYAEFIEAVGDRLHALHINSNEGTITDQHLFPFTIRGRQPDWKEFMRSLDKAGYHDLFNFEVPGEALNVPLPVRKMKLRYAKDIAAFMMSDEFLN